MAGHSHIPYSEHLDYPEKEHDARMMVGDPKSMAWAWIWSYAQNISENISDYDRENYGGSDVTADELIEAGMSWVDGAKYSGSYISKGGAFESMSVDSTFWDKLAILKDLDIPEDKRNNFFSCSC